MHSRIVLCIVVLILALPVAAATYNFTNMPPSMTVHHNIEWTSLPPGWGLANRQGTIAILADATSPTGGSLRMDYPAGMADAQEAGVAYTGGGAMRDAEEMFIGVVMKYSPNWIAHTNQVKLHLWNIESAVTGSQIQWFGMFDGCWGSPAGTWSMASWGMSPIAYPNKQGDCWINDVQPAYTPGQWAKQEIYARKSTGGQANGIIRVWIDGILVLNATNLVYPDNFRWGEFQHAGTWGGGGQAVPHNQQIYFAKTLLAAGNGAPPPDTTPPTATITAPTAEQVLAAGTTQTTLSVTTNEAATCRYSTTDQSYASMTSTMTGSGTATHTSTITGLTNGQSYTYYVRCNDTAGNAMTSSQSRSFSVATSTPPETPATLLFFEGFEDTSMASRNWYDGSGIALSTTETVPGSTRSMEWRWRSGQVLPDGIGAWRRLFPSSESVYASYWVKTTSNWVGSNQAYHPHMFLFVSDLEGAYVGPAVSTLTLYMEHNGGRVLAGAQDARNINASAINQNLIGMTENRAVSGCNGQHEAGIAGDCYWAGSQYRNGKFLTTPVVFENVQGPTNMNAWRYVEYEFRMNSIVGGIAQPDGVMRVWVDGELLIDRSDMYFRTGQNPTMALNQFFIGPYIGDGSPVDQTMWIDNLTVATGRVAPYNAPTQPPTRVGDLNNDGIINIQDVILIVENFRRRGNYDPGADINGDGTVNILDMVLLAREWAADEGTPADTTPPTATITAPTANQVLAAGTTSTTLSVSTNEAATCRYSTTDESYGSMPSTFTTTGGTSHSATITGLTNGGNYLYYIRCQDTAGNAMTSSQSRSFSVAETQPPASLWPNEPSGYSVVRESSWESATLGTWTSGTRDGWNLKFFDGTRSVAIETIPDGVLGESRALTYVYPPNHASGGGVESFISVPAGRTQCYVGAYVRLSENWYGHGSSITKVFYIQGSSIVDNWNAMWYQANGNAYTALVPSIVDQLEGGTHRRVDGTTGSIVRGEWHVLEGILELPSGRTRYYVDNVLQIDSTGGGPAGIVEVTLSGILGGVGTMSNPEEQRMQFDRVRVSCAN